MKTRFTMTNVKYKLSNRDGSKRARNYLKAILFLLPKVDEVT